VNKVIFAGFTGGDRSPLDPHLDGSFRRTVHQ